MKLIGIFGGSGAGKSTTGMLLNQLLDNSFFIPIDPFMHKYVAQFTPYLCQKYNIKTKPKHFLSYIASHGNSNKCWVDEIKGCIESDVWSIIDSFNDQDYIILDWAFLPYSELFNQCDATILVEGNDDLKYARLKARIEAAGKISHWNEEQLRARIDNSKIDCQGVIPTYTVINDNNHSLSNQLIEIVDDIINKERK